MLSYDLHDVSYDLHTCLVIVNVFLIMCMCVPMIFVAFHIPSFQTTDVFTHYCVFIVNCRGFVNFPKVDHISVLAL